MNTENIKNFIRSYKKICAEIMLFETLYSCTKKIEQLKKQKSVIYAWLCLLSEQENFIIYFHLVCGFSWQKVIDIYAKTWGLMETRHERTLKRIQQTAINKILDNIRINNLENEISFLFGKHRDTF